MSAKRDLRKEEKLDELRAEREMNARAAEIRRQYEANKLAAMTPDDRLDYVQKKSRKKLILAAVAVAIVILFNLATTRGSSTPDNSAAQATSVAQDASAIMACDHFANVWTDYGKGILSTPELRDKIKQVYGDAQYATSAGIADGAQALLAAATVDDGNAFWTAASAFSNACQTIGH